MLFFYGYETWSFTLRVLKNRLIRRLCGPRREEVAGGCRRLHNEELHNLYTSPNVIRVIKSRRMGWAGHVSVMGKMRNAYNILARKPEGKSPLGMPRRRWEDDIRKDLRDMG
jgi:hypothetical protein